MFVDVFEWLWMLQYTCADCCRFVKGVYALWIFVLCYLSIFSPPDLPEWEAPCVFRDLLLQDTKFHPSYINSTHASCHGLSYQGALFLFELSWLLNGHNYPSWWSVSKTNQSLASMLIFVNDFSTVFIYCYLMKAVRCDIERPTWSFYVVICHPPIRYW